MTCCSLKRICLDIVSFVRRGAEPHIPCRERETSDEQRSCQFVVGSVLVMVLKLFFTVVSVGFKSAMLAINWVSVSALNFLPFAQSHGSAVMRGEGLIESHCWRTAKCPVRALFSLSRIDDGSSIKVMVCCTCSCTA